MGSEQGKINANQNGVLWINWHSHAVISCRVVYQHMERLGHENACHSVIYYCEKKTKEEEEKKQTIKCF